MPNSLTAKESAERLNQLLRDCKQVPHPTPILGSPRIQGWIAGYAQALANQVADPEIYIREFYVIAMDGTSMGQAFGIDMAISKQRIDKEGPTLGYNSVYFEFYTKGQNEAALEDLTNSTLFKLLSKK